MLHIPQTLKVMHLLVQIINLDYHLIIMDSFLINGHFVQLQQQLYQALLLNGISYIYICIYIDNILYFVRIYYLVFLTINDITHYRCTLIAYFLYTIVITIWIYPLVVHWFWAENGWLSIDNMDSVIPGGIVDFGGSGVVHIVGGFAGLIGTYTLGSRLNRFDDLKTITEGQVLFVKKGKRPIQIKKIIKMAKERFEQTTIGNNVMYQVIGVFILWFGWYGFNTSSSQSFSQTSKILVNTTLAGDIYHL